MSLLRSWDRHGRRPARRQQSSGPRAPRVDERFNHWLDQKLRRLYEAELSEPVPEDMLRLLEALESELE